MENKERMEYLESLNELARLTGRLKQENNHFVLVLGAGASKSSGCELLDDIAKTINIEERLNYTETGYDLIIKIRRYLKEKTREYNYSLLCKHLKGRELSLGYYCLAKLISDKYFDGKILTLNLDSLLEHSLQSKDINLIYPDDFLVLIPPHDGRNRNEEINEEEFLRRTGFEPPNIKIIKLHGDLYTRIFRFHPGDTFRFSEKIMNFLKNILDNYVIIVGYSMSFSDLDFINCFERNRNREIWYVNPVKPETRNSFANLYAEAVEYGFLTISDNAGCFDEFFVRLFTELQPESDFMINERMDFFIKMFDEYMLRYDRTYDENQRQDLLKQALVDLDTIPELGFEKPKLYYAFGEANRKLGKDQPEKYDVAIEHYSKALGLNIENSKECYYQRGDCYLERAKDFCSSKEYKKAVEYYKNAIKDFRSALYLSEDRDRTIYEKIDQSISEMLLAKNTSIYKGSILFFHFLKRRLLWKKRILKLRMR